MSRTLRRALQGFELKEAEHVGLALGRLLEVKGDGQVDSQLEHLTTITDIIETPKIYKEAFERWHERTEQLVKFKATTTGALAIGLGNASAYEVGLTLHHTYGVPYLPASALKGLALRAARVHELLDEQIRLLFGEQDPAKSAYAGHVSFFDAWMDEKEARPLQLDTITVHHPKYYQDGKNGQECPSDFDDPVPVPFISVRPKTTFHVRLAGPSDWACLAAELLSYGLEHLGLGGKTNAGYGGFHCDEITRPLTEAERAAKEEEQHVVTAKELAEDIKTNRMKNARGIRENKEEVFKMIEELPLKYRKDPVEAVQKQATTFGDKKLKKEVQKLLKADMEAEK